MKWRDNLTKIASGTETSLRMVSRFMAFVAAFVLLSMMLLTVADVSGRYFFSRPIDGTWEIIGLLLVCAGTWGLAFCQMGKAHISVTVLLDLFTPRVQAGIRCLAYLIGFTAFSLMCWQAMLLAHKYFFTRGYITDTLHIPLYPFMLIMVVGTGMLALILLIDLLHALREMVNK